ncbi:sensor histidine kinase [Glycomyces xiaoerkulensis]|uniref:sensor histidine kinase n=1 Tax=Glycomyces xiaoerkulensis TaxID=2038139 RepID=UPI0012FFDB31|nr:histidine kinase [Glycomyces xiaoerkulensis]
MSRMWAQILGGVFATLACLATAVPVVIFLARGEPVTSIPGGWWLACFAVFMAAFAATMWLGWMLPRRVTLALFAVQVVGAQVLVLTSPGIGWVAILLVFNAAMCGSVVGPRVSAVVVASNTAVIALGSAGGSTLELALGTGLYVVLQVAAYLSVVAMHREGVARKQLSEANVRLRAAGALLAESSRTEERLRIARELHDLVGHQLTVLSLELEVASHRAEGEAAEPIRRSRELTRRLLCDVRATVGEMRRDGPRLRETLESIVAELPEPAVHLRIDESVETGEEVAAILVRCVQEVVTNAIRHAEASHLWIEIGADGERVTFEARDDGVGARRVEMGNGLRGMAERLEARGGRVRFCGADGFRVRAEVPAA